MGNRLAGKVAVVTGIGSGIGKGCALHFAREGARVYGCDLNEAAAAATAAEAAVEGLDFHVAGGIDLTDEVRVKHYFAEVGREAGAIDALVTAAAAAVFTPVDQMSYADWRFTIAAELDNVFLCVREAWPWLKVRGGAIVNFASANAYVTLAGSYASAHCAGKGGILAMTRQLAAEGGPHGIRANTISPGPILTGATQDVFTRPEMHPVVMQKLFIKRLGLPQDIANAALFLCSDEAGFVTGADLRVDGGAVVS